MAELLSLLSLLIIARFFNQGLDMKKELINQLHHDFESIVQNNGDIEFWYARDLQRLLGCNEWRLF